MPESTPQVCISLALILATIKRPAVQKGKREIVRLS
jgi:hypothetical protein